MGRHARGGEGGGGRRGGGGGGGGGEGGVERTRFWLATATSAAIVSGRIVRLPSVGYLSKNYAKTAAEAYGLTARDTAETSRQRSGREARSR